MINDGRILVLATLAPFIAGVAFVRGSRSELGRRMPVFALQEEFLDEDFDSPKLRSRIYNAQSMRKLRNWSPDSEEVLVTAEDWRKLQTAYRLLPKMVQRDTHLASLQGRVPPQGKAALQRIQASSKEQQKLVRDLLASLRHEIVGRGRS